MARLLDILDPSSMDLDFTAPTTDAAIDRLVALIGNTGAIVDPVAFADAVKTREATSSTGLGDGIAIPHGKSDGISRPAVAFARSVAGVPWGAGDGSPANLIFLIGVPAAQAGDEHLRILAMLARRLVRPAFREALLSADGPAEVRAVLEEVSS